MFPSNLPPQNSEHFERGSKKNVRVCRDGLHQES